MGYHRYCNVCGVGLSWAQWERSSYCMMCGTLLCKEAFRVSSGAFAETIGGLIPVCAVRPLQRACTAVGAHPFLCSAGALGAGLTCMALGPLMITAGNAIILIGGIIAGIGILAGMQDHYTDREAALRLGLRILCAGAVVYGSGYAMLGAGGVVAAGGAGLGVFTGASALSGRIRSRKLVERLRLEEEAVSRGS